MALSANIVIDFQATLTKPRDLNTALIPLSKRVAYALVDGTGANQVNILFDDNRSLTTTGVDVLNLASGMTNGFGDAIAAVKIKGIFIVSSPTNANPITLRQAASSGVPLFTGATAGINIRPGGSLLWVAAETTGIAVTVGSSLLEVVNGGVPTISYDLVILGATV
jgi:hypothetical protein